MRDSESVCVKEQRLEGCFACEDMSVSLIILSSFVNMYIFSTIGKSFRISSDISWSVLGQTLGNRWLFDAYLLITFLANTTNDPCLNIAFP